MTAGGSDPRTSAGLTAHEAAAPGSAIGEVRYRVHVDLAEFVADGTFSTTTEVRSTVPIPAARCGWT